MNSDGSGRKPMSSVDLEVEKSKYLNMPVNETRRLYKCGDEYKVVKNIKTWLEQCLNGNTSDKEKGETSLSHASKVSMWRGDITTLEVDAIVNAANRALKGGGGVDGAIHRAAGGELLEECKALHGCDVGDAKITGGYRLPAKYVIHTVGPNNQSEEKLRSCYNTCLNLVAEHNIRTVAFPCISTGVYGYPQEKAAHVALGTVQNWLKKEKNAASVERIIFCLFDGGDVMIYERLMHEYFPVPDKAV